MASQFDESDFIDRDYLNAQSAYASGPNPSASGVLNRPPTREELDAQVGEAQQKLAELRRAQEQLERERVALEEGRRRRAEYQAGREEMLEHLTRGVALLEQAEFAARRDAEQMAKTLGGLRESLTKVQSIQEENWNQENWKVELSKALATIENARMEWNQARLKWELLNGQGAKPAAAQGAPNLPALGEGRNFWQLCTLGLALTWPVAVVGLIALLLTLFLRFR